jgi:hypothetical protein
MKKLFVSCPVAGRKIGDVVTTINKMHKIAEIVFDQELEVIDMSETMFDLGGSIVEETSVKTMAERIKYLDEADYFIGLRDWLGDRWMHCNMERGIVEEHMNIPTCFMDGKHVAPDLEEVSREYQRKKHPVCDGNACTPYCE